MQITQKGMSSYLIVIFGPPASGKSSLAHDIHSQYRKQLTQNYERPSLLLSADCLQEFLRNHTVSDLQSISDDREQFEKLMQVQLKRAEFQEENWKRSRLFIKQKLAQWLSKYSLIILEDDMLLKSQRKQIRHIAEQTGSLYLEICIDVTLEQCLAHLKQREANKGIEYHLSASACKEAFEKFEADSHPHLLKLIPPCHPSWSDLASLCKVVSIQHPQLHVKTVSAAENAANDDSEVRIRKFISEIMSNGELQKHYFREREIKEISSLTQSIKKRYAAKHKSFEGFLAFFKSETDFLP